VESLAGNPANALLNYLYALLEGEATIAARVVGLDPGLGLLHADQLNRASFSDDLMEPARPLVDRSVLRLLAERTFAADDFYETRQGVCRVTPPLAGELAVASRDWLLAVGRVAEDVARLLAEGGPGGAPLPTPLTGRRRSAGRGSQARGPRPDRVSRVARGCPWCGAPTRDGRTTCSAACEAAVRAEGLPRFVDAGTRALAERRAQGVRTELTEAGRARIARQASDGVRAAREWQRTHAWPSDMGAFAREIAPGLAVVALSDLVAATGLSRAYLRRVVGGEVVPHPMWWEALRAVARAEPD
jgi:CRISPR associated protein Cas1